MPSALPNYGLDADLKAKYDEKYDHEAEREAAEWIEAITGAKVVGSFGPALKTGEVLCDLLNKIKPGMVPKINKPGLPFKERENITYFQKAVRVLGVHEFSIFGTDDLYDEKNLLSVVNCLHALGGAVQTSVPEFKGPHMGLADTSAVKHDQKRSNCPVTQTGGFAGTMEESVIDTSNSIFRGVARPSTPLGPESGAPSGPDGGLVYGLDAELQAKATAKYDLDDENEVAEWIETITGSEVVGNFAGALKTGEILCELINKIKPGMVGRVNKAGMPFKERENISNFLKACRDLGVHENACFGTDDLYEEHNLLSVVNCLNALGGAVHTSAPSFKGPYIGVEDKSGVKRDKKRSKPMATQSGGFHGTMEESGIDMSTNIVKDVGGATSLDKGATKFGVGCVDTMERSHIDTSKNIDRYGRYGA